MDAAAQLGGPVVLKADVPGLVHKSEAGAVQLELHTREEVRADYRALAQRFGAGMSAAIIQAHGHRGNRGGHGGGAGNGRWVSARERRLATQVLHEPPGGLAAVGLQPCLDAVNQRAAELLVVPDYGMIAGLACQRCASLSRTGDDCPDWGAASVAVPDLIEEMAVATLRSGAQVVAVPDPPGGIAAHVRVPLVAWQAQTA